MYSLLNSIGLVSAQHGYTPGQQGSIFWAIVLAAGIGQLTNPIQNWLYKKYYPTKGPEARLFLSMVSAVLFPVGCFICECPFEQNLFALANLE
jgi:predicted PurR-regulated permease PerM